MQKRLKAISFMLVFLFACASGDITPVAIEDGDMCSFCKMAISEKQFAAEIITENEEVLKFDDIGCMLRHRQRAGDGLRPAATFVADVESRQWLRAEDAIFVRSETMKTPMGSGIVAYGDKASAGSEGVSFESLSATSK